MHFERQEPSVWPDPEPEACIWAVAYMVRGKPPSHTESPRHRLAGTTRGLFLVTNSPAESYYPSVCQTEESPRPIIEAAIAILVYSDGLKRGKPCPTASTLVMAEV